MKKVIVFVTLLFLSGIMRGQITPTNNFISIDVNTPQSASYTYDSAYSKCYSIGMREIGLSFPWTNLETSPGVFNFTYLDIANIYYPASGMPVDLTIAPVNTNIKSVPSDLVSLNYDDPIMVNRFKALLDSIFIHIPNLQLSSLVIGSEADIYLGTNATLWTQYTNFYSLVSAYARTLRPSVKISCEAKLEGLTTYASTYLQTLNTYSDYIGVSYYPLNSNSTAKPVSVVATDIASVVAAYPTKPICFYQYGYPSATVCNSSLNQQEQFIAQTFTTWDMYAANIRVIDFTWLHDCSPAALSATDAYYGISDSIFNGFISSIGLRTYSGNGSNKPAFDELICEMFQHGYNSIVCATGINEVNADDEDLVLAPNPAKDGIYVTLKNGQFDFAEITIYNEMGENVLSKRIENGVKGNLINVDGLCSGIYFVSVKTDNQKDYWTKKIIIERK